MSGSIHQRHDKRAWFVMWYFDHLGKGVKVTRYRGLICETKNMASKLLAAMQGDKENGCSSEALFRKYKQGETDTIPYLYEWLENIRVSISPATYKDYKNSIRNHLGPFFKSSGCQLSEIHYDTLQKLSNSIVRGSKGKKNVLYCLHACLDYAWRSGRIPVVPPFPKIRCQEPSIEWLPEPRQIAVIEAIPQEHQPIFWWLKYHLRRPCEAMALQWEDYDEAQDCFIIRRSVSARKIVGRTKTGSEHIIPRHPVFCLPRKGFSPFVFTNGRSRYSGKRYSHATLSRLWRAACCEVHESIRMYAGLKHSSCCQFINERGYSMSELQVITDHARIDSVGRYAKTELARKRELLEGKIIKLKEAKNGSN
jgi:integrase